MSERRVVTTRRADDDITAAVEHYLESAAPHVASDFIDALQTTIKVLKAHPALGSPRLAIETGLTDIRTLTLARFPYVVIYSDDEDALRVHRVLHTSRDIPEELR